MLDTSNATIEELEAALNSKRLEAHLRAERLANDPWPKYLDTYVHGQKWNESVTEWIDDNTDWDKDDERRRQLAYLNYEVKITYRVHEGGSTEIVAVDGRPVGDNVPL